MRYIVGNRGPLRVGDSDRQPGAPIPEAAEWPTLQTWVSGGYVIEVPDEGEGAPPTGAPTVTRDGVLSFIDACTDIDTLDAIVRASESRRDEVDEAARAAEVASADTGTFDITAVNADQAKAWIAETADVAALEAQNEREVQSQKHEGGRVSVLRAIEARIAELEAADEDTDDEDHEE